MTIFLKIRQCEDDYSTKYQFVIRQCENYYSTCAIFEVAIWDPHSGKLLWVDIARAKLFFYDPTTKENHQILMGQMLVTVVPCT